MNNTNIDPQYLIDQLVEHTARLSNYGIVGDYYRVMEAEGFQGQLTTSLFTVANEYLAALMWEKGYTLDEAVRFELDNLIKAKAAGWAVKIPQIMATAPDEIIRIIDTDIHRAKVIENTIENWESATTASAGTSGRSYTRAGRTHQRVETHQNEAPRGRRNFTRQSSMTFTEEERNDSGTPNDETEYRRGRVLGRVPKSTKDNKATTSTANNDVQEPVIEESIIGLVVGDGEVTISGGNVKYEDHQVKLGRKPISGNYRTLPERKRSVLLAPLASKSALRQAEAMINEVPADDDQALAEIPAKLKESVGEHISDRCEHLDNTIIHFSGSQGYCGSITQVRDNLRLSQMAEDGMEYLNRGYCFAATEVEVLEFYGTNTDWESHNLLNAISPLMNFADENRGLVAAHNFVNEYISENGDNATAERMLTILDRIATEECNFMFRYCIGATKAKLGSFLDSFPDAFGYFSKKLGEEVARLLFGEEFTSANGELIQDDSAPGAVAVKRLNCFRHMDRKELRWFLDDGRLTDDVSALCSVTKYAVLALPIGINDLDIYLTSDEYNIIDPAMVSKKSEDVTNLYDTLNRFEQIASKTYGDDAIKIVLLADNTRLRMDLINTAPMDSAVEFKLAIKKV